MSYQLSFGKDEQQRKVSANSNKQSPCALTKGEFRFHRASQDLRKVVDNTRPLVIHSGLINYEYLQYTFTYQQCP